MFINKYNKYKNNKILPRQVRKPPAEDLYDYAFMTTVQTRSSTKNSKKNKATTPPTIKAETARLEVETETVPEYNMEEFPILPPLPLRQPSFSSASSTTTNNTNTNKELLQDKVVLPVEAQVLPVQPADSESQFVGTDDGEVINTNDLTSENDEDEEQASSSKVSQSAYDAQTVYFQAELNRLTQLLLQVVALVAPRPSLNATQEPTVLYDIINNIPTTIHTVPEETRDVEHTKSNADDVPMVETHAVNISKANKKKKKRKSRKGKPKDDTPSDKDNSSDDSSSSSSTSSSSSSTSSSSSGTSTSTSSSSTDDSSSTSSTTTGTRDDAKTETHGRKLHVSTFDEKSAKKIANLSSKVITLLSRCNLTPLTLRGTTQERTISLDNWMDKIQMVAFHHPAMTPVYEKYTTNRTLSIPKKKWVDVALFNILQLFIEPVTRQSLDPAKINTSSGVALWNLLKGKALGDLTLNKEQAHKRLIYTTIRPGQLYSEFIERVQRNAYFCRQSSDKVSEDQLVRCIITGLRGAEHQTHVSALLAMQIQGKTLTVRQIEEYFRLIAPSTKSQNVRVTYGHNNDTYSTKYGRSYYPAAEPVSHSEDAHAALVHTDDDASTGSTSTNNSTSDDYNGRGQPDAENNRSNEPTVQRNGSVHARRLVDSDTANMIVNAIDSRYWQNERGC